MQKELFVMEGTPTVVSWLQIDSKLVGIMEKGECILLATVQSAPAEKPKRRRQRKAPELNEANGETPRRRRGRPALGNLPLAPTAEPASR